MISINVLMVFMAMVSSTVGLRLSGGDVDPKGRLQTNIKHDVWGIPIGVTDHERKDNLACSFQDEHKNPAWCNIETPEHELVRNHLSPNSVVLELGARYGTTSCEIAVKQKNSGMVVSVDPDPIVWGVYEQNIQNHHCNANLYRGIVGTKDESQVKGTGGYGTRYEFFKPSSSSSSLPGSMSFFDLQKTFRMEFDTLLIDCEGCVNNLLDQNPGMLANITTILMEGDQGIYKGDKAPDCGEGSISKAPCIDYNAVIRRFEHEGFSVVDTFKEGDIFTRLFKNDCCPWIHHFALKRRSPEKK